VSRWLVLAVGTAAQTSQAAAAAGLAVLAPALRDRYDLGLGEVGVLLAGGGVGAMLTLLPWGLAADRLGERVTGSIGLAGSAGGLAAAAFASSFAWLVAFLALAGAFGAATNSATGRAVMGWFGRRERGLALAVRQTAIPIGGFTAAVGLPPIASAWGSREALLALAAGAGVSALAAAVVLREGPADPEEGDPAELLRHPLRDRRIWRLSVGSSLLVWPQIAMLGFVVVFLEDARGFSTAGAAAVLAGINVVGGVGRLASGRVSDRLGRRLAPLRAVAGATALALAAVAALTSASPWLLCPALVVGGGLAMSWNALSYAAAAETAGRARSGAAVGLQQTALAVSGALTPLAFAPLVDATSWRVGFAAAAAVPVLAIVVLRPLEP
jgi:sugar phosphate permease